MKEKEEGRVEGIRETGSVGRLANGDKRLALHGRPQSGGGTLEDGKIGLKFKPFLIT